MLYPKSFLPFQVSFILLLITVNVLSGQDIHFRFGHVGEAQGLTNHSYNTFVTKDSHGFVWISSSQGCFRFDGQSSKHYPIDEAQGYEPFVQSRFFEDDDSNMWFTSVNGLHCYKRKEDKLQSIKMPVDSSSLHAFHFDKNASTIWLSATNKYFWKHDITSNQRIDSLYRTEGMRFLTDTLPNGAIGQIFAFPWFSKEGFERWDFTKETPTQMKYEKGIIGKAFINEGILKNDSIIWLVSDLGLLEYNFRNENLIENYTIEKGKKTHFWSATQHNDSLIVSSKKGGLWVFDLNEKIFVKNERANINNPFSLSSNQPQKLYLSEDKQLWITQIRKGLDYTIPETQKFYNPLQKYGEITPVSIIEDDLHRVWVLTEQLGLFVFDLNMKLLHRVEKIENIEEFSFSHLSKDNAGSLWLSIDKQIFKCELNETFENCQWSKVTEIPNRIVNLNHTLSGKLVVGSFKGGIIIDKETGKIEDGINGQKADAGLSYFLNLNKEKWGVLLRDDGVNIVSTETGTLQNEMHLGKGRQSIDCIQRKNNDYLLCTYNGILSIEEEREEVWERETAFYSVIEDANGNIWAGTDQGIYLRNKKTNKEHFFVREEGLSSETFIRFAKRYTSDGKIWLANEKGLTVFHPDSIYISPLSASVYFNNLWINEKLYQGESVNEITELSLDYFANTLDFDIQTLGMLFARNSTIEYRLKNYQDNWVKLKSGSIIRYTKLPPGDFILEVRAIDGKNRVTKTRTLPIKIAKPFWQTTWFILLCLMSIIAFIFGIASLIYRKQIQEQKRLLEREKALNTERNRIAKELHDDMGGGLSSILFLSEDLLFEEKDKQKQKPIN